MTAILIVLTVLFWIGIIWGGCVAWSRWGLAGGAVYGVLVVVLLKLLMTP